MLRPRAPDISDVASPGYRRRRQPEQTALYRIVQQHLEAFLEEARERYARGLPRYVEQELRAYLKCGILAHGFARAECRLCGAPLLVAFSCKRRGVCPSCNARRMHNTAAHLVDRVFPDVPLRQWVLTVPFDLRLLLASNARAFGAMCRIQAEELLRFHERRARQAGIGKHAGQSVRVRGAGVSFPQRFGGSLNLNTHNHAAFVDGVFAIEPGSTPGAAPRARFHQLPPPGRDEIDALCDRIATRFTRWLERRGLITPEPDHFNNEPPEQSALDSCSQLSLGIGVLASVPGENARPADAGEQAELAKLQPPRGRRSRYLGEAQGFGLHAAVCVPAHNRFGRELLLRYCGRPPFSLERLSLLPSGHVAYQIKSPWRPDQTHRVMEPLEFLARLAALVPPPRTPLIRFHGAIAPNFPHRGAVVALAPRAGVERNPQSCSGAAAKREARRPDDPPPRRCTEAPTESATATRRTLPNAACLPRAPEPTPSVTADADAPASRAGADCDTLRTFESAISRIDWATLLGRVYDIDALACPCGGRLRFTELVTDPDEARTVLEALSLPSTPPPIRPAHAAPDLLDLPPPDP